MTLKTKFRLLLVSALVTVPVIMLVVGVLVSLVYDAVFKTANGGIPFYASFAYPVMLGLFLCSLLLIALLFSRSIHSLLKRINLLNQTVRELASDEKIPDTLSVYNRDEIGDLIRSVNLLIERTTYRELQLREQEELNKEMMNKLRHDINTPLTAMRLQLFDLEIENPEHANLTWSMSRQIQYISELTTEFRFHSASAPESSYILKDRVNLHELLETMVKKWAYLYSVQSMNLQYACLNRELNWTSNVLWLQRLFDNIFQNALRHSNASIVKVTIKDNMVTIRDNGTGFDVHGSHSGLGLKIIEDLSQVLHIAYTLQSDGSGTLYRFTAEAF
ncbi:sensor histidine kinase [Paenibacillus sp. GCM10012306]|uniref:sensor histidine kinase n=1 Tax=Paenibacillus sp. GCM10012306 TaxID=3317342 RepID=UPI003613D235